MRLDGLSYLTVPLKRIQWSDNGVVSSNKFLQKIWDLNYSIRNRKENKVSKDSESEFISLMNNFIIKINNSINGFRFNVAIASFYEIFNNFNSSLNKNLSNKILKEYIIKINKLMIPFTPHLSRECLKMLNCVDYNEWPKIEKNIKEEINFAIQINGKTRDIIKIKKDSIEEVIKEKVLHETKARKYLLNKKILKTIFVKNKIINYIIKN